MRAQGLQVAVVGGGITGLLAARQLADAGAQVTVLESRGRLGGQIHSVAHDERTVDLGAEALHTAAPGCRELLDQLGLAHRAVNAASGTTWIARPQGLRPLPAGMGPTGPTRLGPVASSRILSPIGLLRAACEPLRPRTRIDGDLAVGAYLTARFGREVTERLLDPLLGNLHAGDVNRLSLAAATPQLAALAHAHRSMVLARRRTPARSGGASFVTVRGGLALIVAQLGADPRLEIRTSTPVDALEPDGTGYRIVTRDARERHVDAVVLATPAATASRLLAPVEPEAAALGTIRTASVATVVVGYDAGVARELSGTGLLVPSTSSRWLKAATFLSAKWPHLADGPSVLVRLSAGRADDRRIDGLDDAALVDRLHADLAALTGISYAPVSAHVQRWPDTMPQLEVGHRERVAAARRRLAYHRIVVAGASYDGVGIACCRRSAADAVDRLLATTSPPPRHHLAIRVDVVPHTVRCRCRPQGIDR